MKIEELTTLQQASLTFLKTFGEQLKKLFTQGITDFKDEFIMSVWRKISDIKQDANATR